MTHLTDKQAEALIEQKERAKQRREYNQWCQEQADKIDKEGAGKTISFEEYDKNHRLQIAINKYNRTGEEE